MSRGPYQSLTSTLSSARSKYPKTDSIYKNQGTFSKATQKLTALHFTFDIECKTCYYVTEEFYA